ncbi:hypothetical protein ONA02_02250 [Mycoplasmopsis felis]|nr:hypothetical protein [Mycoplasmopsis felis]UWV78176.1 hypothetical protein NWE59_04460 [Mycoplasmopsis felis]WAM02633.1 hypothetical protein ONA02_02250 [Mycoplasmopsis felis]
MIKNSETLLSINSDTVMVKEKTDMNNTYEVSMDLTIHKLKEQENQSLKLKLNQDEENITITEIDYNTWSGEQSDNTISSNPQGGETTENPQNNPMSATPEDSATDGDSDMSRTNTLVITKKIIFTITNNSNQSKTINLKEVLLGETKIVDLTQVPNFVIPGKTANPDNT